MTSDLRLDSEESGEIERGSGTDCHMDKEVRTQAWREGYRGRTEILIYLSTAIGLTPGGSD